MTVRPDHIRDLAEVLPEDATLYAPDPSGDGYTLNPALAARADRLAAELNAAQRARDAALIDGQLHLLLATAGVDPLIIPGGIALWRQMANLVVVGDEVRNDRGVPLAVLFYTWAAEGDGRAFLRAAAVDAKPAASSASGGPGRFAAAVKALH